MFREEIYVLVCMVKILFLGHNTQTKYNYVNISIILAILCFSVFVEVDQVL